MDYEHTLFLYANSLRPMKVLRIVEKRALPIISDAPEIMRFPCLCEQEANRVKLIVLHRFISIFHGRESRNCIMKFCCTTCTRNSSFPFNFYCLQMKFAKVMFLQVSVCPQGGVCGRGACMTGSIHGRGHAWHAPLPPADTTRCGQ